jgi:hypothetical protein
MIFISVILMTVNMMSDKPLSDQQLKDQALASDPQLCDPATEDENNSDTTLQQNVFEKEDLAVVKNSKLNPTVAAENLTNLPYFDPHPDWLNTFMEVYQKLSSDNLVLLESIYDQQVTFIDPIHEINGLENLHQYFVNLYQNLSCCNFNISNVIAQPNQASIYWEMTYQHPKLNKGKVVSVFGSSHLCAKKGKVIYHRDYLDLGAMLYEQLPLFGRIVSWIKNKAAK